MTAALEITQLGVRYGTAIEALEGVSITVPDGGFVAILGANGAGKSTLLKAASGLLRFENGRIFSGSIQFRGRDISRLPSYQLARLGILQVREGRFVFPDMTVEENLDAATFARGSRKTDHSASSYDDIFHYFPVLAERRRTKAGYLSGGEQQMLAVGRALFGHPELLMVDEASLGLAPKIAAEIFVILSRIRRDRNLSILVVEQNVSLALRHASYGYVLENGSVVEEGDAATLLDRGNLAQRYLGVDAPSTA